MIFPLDTNAFSDLMRKHAKVEAPLTSLTAGDRVIMGPIVRDEIRYGTLSTTRVTREAHVVGRSTRRSLEPTLIAWKIGLILFSCSYTYTRQL